MADALPPWTYYGSVQQGVLYFDGASMQMAQILHKRPRDEVHCSRINEAKATASNEAKATASNEAKATAPSTTCPKQCALISLCDSERNPTHGGSGCVALMPPGEGTLGGVVEPPLPPLQTKIQGPRPGDGGPGGSMVGSDRLNVPAIDNSSH